MKLRCWPLFLACAFPFTRLPAQSASPAFDAAPFARPLPEDHGLIWDDPREIHKVVVHFAAPVGPSLHPRLEYWGSHWPKQHLPKDREPGGGDVGWLELGNWYNGGWRVADAEQTVKDNTVQFVFHPVDAKEFPDVTNYPANFRFTFKLRISADQPLPPIRQIQALTDSTLEPRSLHVVWRKQTSGRDSATAFNGSATIAASSDPLVTDVDVLAVRNPDPNTFDRTLVTIRRGKIVFTIKVDDLDQGAIFMPEFGAAVLPDGDSRRYEDVAREVQQKGDRTLYDRVAALPEQTWPAAWDGMPAKKSRICFPLGLDGARQKFRLDANGEVFIRWNDQFMLSRPGQDTPRLAIEKQPVHFRFGLPDRPDERHIDDERIPICFTTWSRDGVRITQTAFATELDGTKDNGQPPQPDVCAVALLRFEFTNTTDSAQAAALPVTIRGGEPYDHLRVDSQGLIWNGQQVRGQILVDPLPLARSNQLDCSITLPPHAVRQVIVKMPYLPLTETSERQALAQLNFEGEQRAIHNYWSVVLDRGARLITPEPVLTNFYRAVPGHLLINSEFDPGSTRRFARVGSFNYGSYGNESCMMILDLDRRGYHREAAECLEAWLHYQGTVELPGDFDSKEGVLYGAGGYESGGYNQHHGWILWTLAEHYRFTRDDAWLRHAAPGILAGADWIIRETRRAADRNDLARNLLPAGDLEDIGDWWTWLSTSCYTWRGLDGAAWALAQLHHPEAARIRRAADAYHTALIENFTAASVRSPVVRLRDGTAVPQIPSYVQRRGRSFGWIEETLEGAIHLIITGAIDPKSPQAEWILKDYEDNLFLSNQYGYTVNDFDRYWFGRGGMSMQACLLFDVEAYLFRDDVKQALRAMFNAIAVNHFPDVHMNTEHALPEMGDWRGDHYKTSDEANACGWMRFLFAREEENRLLIGQAIPRDWLKSGQQCGLQNAATYFGPISILYRGGGKTITADLDGPVRNPPKEIRLRFRHPNSRNPSQVTVNGSPWKNLEGDWVILPGNIGHAQIVAAY